MAGGAKVWLKRWVTICVDTFLSIVSVTNSSLLGMARTSLEAASLHLRSMGDTNSSLLDLVATSLDAALFPRCTMCDTYSPFLA